MLCLKVLSAIAKSAKYYLVQKVIDYTTGASCRQQGIWFKILLDLVAKLLATSCIFVHFHRSDAEKWIVEVEVDCVLLVLLSRVHNRAT